MQYFDGNKDKKLTWSALLFGDDKGLTGGGKADSTDDACHRQKELFSELYRITRGKRTANVQKLETEYCKWPAGVGRRPV